MLPNRHGNIAYGAYELLAISDRVREYEVAGIDRRVVADTDRPRGKRRTTEQKEFQQVVIRGDQCFPRFTLGEAFAELLPPGVIIESVGVSVAVRVAAGIEAERFPPTGVVGGVHRVVVVEIRAEKNGRSEILRVQIARSPASMIQ